MELSYLQCLVVALPFAWTSPPRATKGYHNNKGRVSRLGFLLRKGKFRVVTLIGQASEPVFAVLCSVVLHFVTVVLLLLSPSPLEGHHVRCDGVNEHA
jgi:hypothetical protein